MIWNNELTDKSLGFVLLSEQAYIYQMLSVVRRSD